MIIAPHIIITPDLPTVQFREPRELVDLDRELQRALNAQGWGVGTYFNVQFLTHDRTTLLASLEMVDFVVPFSEDTPEALIQEITPAVLVKGEDWRERGAVGAEWVEQHGGRVFFAPLLEGRSTSNLVERIRNPDGA